MASSMRSSTSPMRTARVREDEGRRKEAGQRLCGEEPRGPPSRVEIERPFELHLQEATVTGRADVILDREGGIVGSMAILDYKTAVDEEPDALHKLQLAVYAAAAKGEGINVRAAYLHDLTAGERIMVRVGKAETQPHERKPAGWRTAFGNASFHPRTGAHCLRCDVRQVCSHRKVKR